MSFMTCYQIVRTGSAAPDALSFGPKAAAFGSSVRNCRETTLLVVHDPEAGIAQYVIVPDNKRRPEQVAANAATAVSARHEEVDLPDLDTSHVARMVANPDTNAARETQSGADPNQIAQYFAHSLEEGCWLAVTMRDPAKAEIRNTRRWYDHRLGNTAVHHSRSGEALIVSVWAGGPDKEAVESLLHGAVSTMPGFDVEAEPRSPMGWPIYIAVGVLLSVLTWFGINGTEPISELWPGIADMVNATPIIGFIMAVSVLLGIFSPKWKAKSAIRKGRIPLPRHKTAGVAAPRKERVIQQGENTRVQQASDGSYPLQKDVFLVGPSVVLGVVSPHTGEATEAAVTKMRNVPTALRANIGPVAGSSGGHWVHISQADRYGGVACFGAPGTGKSVFITNIFGYDSACKVRHRKMGTGWQPVCDGDVGYNNTLIAFENKGRDGVGVYRQYADHFGDQLGVVEVADPNTPAIDMFPNVGTTADRAAFFVDSMVYAFGEQAIGNRSQNTLNYLVTLALLMTPEDIVVANQVLPQPLDPNMSTLEIVDALLTSRGDEVAVRLGYAVTERFKRDGGNELGEAIQRCEPMLGPKTTPSQRRTLAEAPQSKVALLLKNRSWWDQRRVRVSWDTLINGHASVVINAGQSTSGQTIDSGLTETLLAMLTYGLQKAIERNCAGWNGQGRAVSIYSDELSLLAGKSNSDVFQWLRNQGRSFGVRTNFATQIPEQLEPVLRSTVTGFSTFLWLGQSDPDVANVAVADLSADGSEWTVSDITTLEKYHGVLRATVGQRQPSVPIKTVYYGEERMSEFLQEQGLAA